MALPSQLHKACDLILFGVLGDLASRKLLPALYQLECANLLHPKTQFLGVAREALNEAQFTAHVEGTLNKSLGASRLDALSRFLERWRYTSLDLTQVEKYKAIPSFLNASNVAISYLATPPTLFESISKGLAQIGLTKEPARIILEKPLGYNLASATKINSLLSHYFKEQQIYRIDHYLGKETVLNLLVLRFANALFSANWDNTAIEHVQITVAEEVGVASRLSYYDEAGQTRDMLQSHLLQILSLIAMEPPSSLSADNIRDEKLKVLKALRPISLKTVQQKTVRGQYTQGFIQGKAVLGYLEEEGVDANSTTETFVAIKANIDNWRWAGVPFYLRTGKRMAKKQSEVAIYFKPQPHNIFYNFYRELYPNKLIIRLQPDEGVEVQIMNKVPGLGESMQLRQSKLDLSFDTTFKSGRIVDAYERLLLEIMLGSQYLFVRRDEVEQAWVWVDGILDAWKNHHEPLCLYPAGTFGPQSATNLLARNGRTWDE